MPVKKAVAKKKRTAEIQGLMSPEAQRKAERALKHFVDELDERSEERFNWVEKILSVNDEETVAAHAAMVEVLKRMEGPPKVIYKGQQYNAIKGETELLERIQERNFAWIAMRLLVACAEWNIRIGNFKMPADSCARCGKSVRRARAKKK